MQNLKPFTQLLRRDTYTLKWAVSKIVDPKIKFQADNPA